MFIMKNTFNLLQTILTIIDKIYTFSSDNKDNMLLFNIDNKTIIDKLYIIKQRQLFITFKHQTVAVGCIILIIMWKKFLFFYLEKCLFLKISLIKFSKNIPQVNLMEKPGLENNQFLKLKISTSHSVFVIQIFYGYYCAQNI